VNRATWNRPTGRSDDGPDAITPHQASSAVDANARTADGIRGVPGSSARWERIVDITSENVRAVPVDVLADAGDLDPPAVPSTAPNG